MSYIMHLRLSVHFVVIIANITMSVLTTIVTDIPVTKALKIVNSNHRLLVRLVEVTNKQTCKRLEMHCICQTESRPERTRDIERSALTGK